MVDMDPLLRFFIGTFAIAVTLIVVLSLGRVGWAGGGRRGNGTTGIGADHASGGLHSTPMGANSSGHADAGFSQGNVDSIFAADAGAAAIGGIAGGFDGGSGFDGGGGGGGGD